MEHKDDAVRISLVDVLYGVVLGYGFTYFDKASTGIDYFRFFFAYFVIMIDWIYVHRLYWGWEYKYNSILLLDIGVIFTISRLLHTSTNESSYYFLWIAVLFGLYVAWDIVSKIKELPTEYDWIYSIVGDSIAGLLFLGIWYGVTSAIIQQTPIMHGIVFLVYVFAVAAWFKKSPKAARPAKTTG